MPTDRELGVMLAEQTGASRWLALLDPDSPSYNPAYRANAMKRLGLIEPAGAYPPKLEQARNALEAVGRAIKAELDGRRITVDQAEHDRRLAICQEPCEHYDPCQGRCRKCGCKMSLKTRLATEHCPLDPPKW